MNIPVIDQRDLQKRGGVCARVPVACLVADILADAGIDARKLVVFDMTYGEGRFWAAIKPAVLIGADIKVFSWVVEPDVFIKKPVWASWKILRRLNVIPDMVVLDPPWVVKGSDKRPHFGLYRAFGRPDTIVSAGIEAARGLGSRWLLLHYKQRLIPDGFRPVAEREWLPVTRYNNYSEDKPTTWWGLLARVRE